jgi:hypothetical protein
MVAKFKSKTHLQKKSFPVFLQRFVRVCLQILKKCNMGKKTQNLILISNPLKKRKKISCGKVINEKFIEK